MNLQCNHLIKLPKAFGNLSNLSSLNLCRNKLTYLPENFGSLNNLESLNLSGNKIWSLPKSFKKLGNLKNINLWMNSLGGYVNPKILENIFIILAKLPKLRKLGIGRNSLSCLPEIIGQLSNLTELDLQENKIKNFSSSIRNFPNLSSLNIGYTYIIPFPEEAISGLPKLKSLGLGGYYHLYHNRLNAFDRTLQKVSISLI